MQFIAGRARSKDDVGALVRARLDDGPPDPLVAEGDDQVDAAWKDGMGNSHRPRVEGQSARCLVRVGLRPEHAHDRTLPANFPGNGLDRQRRRGPVAERQGAECRE